MPGQNTIYPIAMTRRKGILHVSGNRIPVYLPNGFVDKVDIADPSEDAQSVIVTERPCITYFVNSQSNGTTRGPAETGKGTKDEPWINVNSVFDDKCIYELCNKVCCQYVKVIITGTVDYYIDGLNKSYRRMLVLDFQSALIINWDKSLHGLTMNIVNKVDGVRFNNFAFTTAIHNVTVDSPGQVDITTNCFYNCPNCTFYNCEGQIRMSNSVTGTGANDHAALYVDYFCNCSGAEILKSKVNLNLYSYGCETGTTDCPISHTRASIVTNCTRTIVMDSYFKIECESKSIDHNTGHTNFVTGIAQAFGTYNSMNAIISNSSIDCNVKTYSDTYDTSFIACPLGSPGATIYNCSLSSPNIQNKGTNTWTTSYNFTCYNQENA